MATKYYLNPNVSEKATLTQANSQEYLEDEVSPTLEQPIAVASKLQYLNSSYTEVDLGLDIPFSRFGWLKITQ